MAVKRKQRIPIDRTDLEKAAIGICRTVYGAVCPCDHAPQVCEGMISAARVCIMIAAPEAMVRLGAETVAARRKKQATAGQ